MSVADDLRDGTLTQAEAIQQGDEQKKARVKTSERIRREVRRELDAEDRQATSTPPPDALTLRERLARPREPVRWRIERLQAKGHRVLFAAQFKAGKTTTAANAARCVLDGDAFLDCFKVNKITGTLALFDFEMDGAQLDGWYADQKIVNDERLFVFPMRGAASSFDIVNADVRAEWVTKLKVRGVVYLILDCLRPVLDALGLNEHTEVGRFLTALDELLREAGIPECIVIQHMGHKNERPRGDSRLLDWPDVGWTLVRETDDDPASARYFKAYGRDVDVAEMQLTYDEKTRRLTVLDAAEGGVSRVAAKVDAALAAVCTVVSHAATPPSGRQIEQALKGEHTQKAIRQAIRKGVELGVLKQDEGRNGGSVYRSPLTDAPGLIPELIGVAKA